MSVSETMKRLVPMRAVFVRHEQAGPIQSRLIGLEADDLAALSWSRGPNAARLPMTLRRVMRSMLPERTLRPAESGQ